MKLIAPGVWQLKGFPPNLVNVHLVEDVLIDAGTRWAWRRIRRQLQGRPLRLVALTHCHPDHQGAASRVCEQWHVPLACHEAEVPALEGRAPMLPDNRLLRLGARLLGGPPHPVARVLRDGEEVAGFRVLHAPGHTPGHVIFFREADRVCLAGDLLGHNGLLPGKTRLREPPTFFSVDPAQNRRSIQLLVQLKPKIICFGHGPPLRQPGLLEQFVACPEWGAVPHLSPVTS